jgi:dethiobiotin synthetase
MSAHGYFITGTDTNVGKTLIACALLHALAQQGLRVVGMKPVAAGAVHTPEGWHNDDVVQLRAAANVEAPLVQINPYCFAPAIAPHLAAAQIGTNIALTQIAQAFEHLAGRADCVIVEGAGGFCVPLNAHEDGADLAARLALPVILVVGLRLGCLNHTLLTAQAIGARGLTLAGWIANRIDPNMGAADANVATLQQRLAPPLLGDIAYTPRPEARAVATQLDIRPLVAMR